MVVLTTSSSPDPDFKVAVFYEIKYIKNIEGYSHNCYCTWKNHIRSI